MRLDKRLEWKQILGGAVGVVDEHNHDNMQHESGYNHYNYGYMTTSNWNCTPKHFLGKGMSK
jgi:hypothetical protein